MVIMEIRKNFKAGGTDFWLPDYYEFREKIGHSTCGVLVLAKDLKSSRFVTIHKVLNVFEDPVIAKRVLRELKLLRFFKHDNVITLIDLILSPGPCNDLYIITEYMEADFDKITKSKQDLTNDHCKYFLYLALRGLLYMHSANVVNCNISASNLMVNSNEDIKFSGFILACPDNGVPESLGKIQYQAPELILSSSKCTIKSDIWAIGCIFAELLGRVPLFIGNNYVELIEKIFEVLGTPGTEDMEFIENISIRRFLMSFMKKEKKDWKILYPKVDLIAIDLLDKMLDFNYKKRITVQECLSHPYFTELHDLSDEPISSQLFNWSFEHASQEEVREMIFEIVQNLK